VSAVTIEFLAWCSAQLAAQGVTALLLIWDNASWHRSQAVRHWGRQHNQQVKRGAIGVRFVVCPLPSKSPWLNPMEPKWIHGKRAVSEPDRRLCADELEARVYAYYGCQRGVYTRFVQKLSLTYYTHNPPLYLSFTSASSRASAKSSREPRCLQRG
jgi:transposase